MSMKTELRSRPGWPAIVLFLFVAFAGMAFAQPYANPEAVTGVGNFSIWVSGGDLNGAYYPLTYVAPLHTADYPTFEPILSGNPGWTKSSSWEVTESGPLDGVPPLSYISYEGNSDSFVYQVIDELGTGSAASATVAIKVDSQHATSVAASLAATSSYGGGDAVLGYPAGAGSGTAIAVIGCPGLPVPVPSAPAQLATGSAYVGLSVTGSTSAGDSASVTVSFYPPAAISGSAANLLYYNSSASAWQAVTAGGNQITYAAPSESAPNGAYTVTLNDAQDSTATSPPVTQLTGPGIYFAMGVPAVVYLAPIANNESVAAVVSQANIVTLTATDPNSPALALNYIVTSLPADGTLSDPQNSGATINSVPYTIAGGPYAAGAQPNLIYTPSSVTSAGSPDSFTFTANNGETTSAPATVTVSVAASSSGLESTEDVAGGQAGTVNLPPTGGGGLTATLMNASVSTDEAVTAAAYSSAPSSFAGFLGGPSDYVDLQVSPQTSPPDDNTLTVTFEAPNISVVPALYFVAPGGGIPELVLDENGNPVPAVVDSEISGYTFTVTLNDLEAPNSSYPNTPPATTPTISELTGTVFGMGTPAVSPSTDYVGNPLPPAVNYGAFDGDPPLVILGEYDPAGPLATSPLGFTIPGTISDVQLYAQSWNFTLYVLQPELPPPAGAEQTFQVVAAQNFSGNMPQAELVTLYPQSSMPVSNGQLLAFAGIGPAYNSSDAVNSDATYEDSANPGSFTATPPGGPPTQFTVGLAGDANAIYDYIGDFFGNQGRNYAIGVDIVPGPLIVNWSNPEDIAAGTALGASQLDATANAAGMFTYNPAAGTVLPSGLGEPLSVTFTPDDTADYSPVVEQVSLNVLNITVPSEGNMSIAVTAEGITVAFAGVPGAIYQVQSSTACTGPWANLGGPLQAESNGLILFTDPTNPKPATQFYRTLYVSGP